MVYRGPKNTFWGHVGY